MTSFLSLPTRLSFRSSFWLSAGFQLISSPEWPQHLLSFCPSQEQVRRRCELSHVSVNETAAEIETWLAEGRAPQCDSWQQQCSHLYKRKENTARNREGEKGWNYHFQCHPSSSYFASHASKVQNKEAREERIQKD